jgi:hypothetical protein
MSRDDSTPLSADEEITLRRVAHGQSDVAHLRAADLVRLRSLSLIAGAPRAPMLTAAGKERFDQLAKPAAMAEFNAQNELMATLGRLMARKAPGVRQTKR